MTFPLKAYSAFELNDADKVRGRVTRTSHSRAAPRRHDSPDATVAGEVSATDERCERGGLSMRMADAADPGCYEPLLVAASRRVGARRLAEAQRRHVDPPPVLRSNVDDARDRDWDWDWNAVGARVARLRVGVTTRPG
jgi:hypothetical protein